MGFQWWCAAQQRPWSWAWQPYPGVWAFVLLLVGGYAVALRRTGARPSRPRLASFAAGALLLWAALDWPLGALGASYLASAHMVQFLLIALVAPPLLLLGIPPGTWGAIAGERGAGPGLRVLTHPLATLLLFGSVLGLTHWPPVVDGLMPAQLGSFALDLGWLVAGTLFWWPVLAPVPRRARFGYPAKMGYLLLGTIVNTAPFLFLTFSRFPVYAIYELAPPVSWLSTRDDQVVAGLLMKMGGAAILWTAITVLFACWYRSQEDLWPEEPSPGPAAERGPAT